MLDPPTSLWGADVSKQLVLTGIHRVKTMFCFVFRLPCSYSLVADRAVSCAIPSAELLSLKTTDMENDDICVYQCIALKIASCTRSSYMMKGFYASATTGILFNFCWTQSSSVMWVAPNQYYMINSIKDRAHPGHRLGAIWASTG